MEQMTFDSIDDVEVEDSEEKEEVRLQILVNKLLGGVDARLAEFRKKLIKVPSKIPIRFAIMSCMPNTFASSSKVR